MTQDLASAARQGTASKPPKEEGPRMNQTVVTTREQSHSLTLAVLGTVALIALWFIVTRALRYSDFSVSTYGNHFWPRRWGLMLHVVGGVVALSTGVVQLWLGLTNRVTTLHRVLGKVYGSAILVGSVGGYYLSVTIPATEVAYAAGLFMLCTAWVITTSMALFAIRRRNVMQHREWMVRSYTVTFAFVTFRLFEIVLDKLHFASREDVATIMSWACWAVPLMLVEPLIQLRKIRAR
jgi:uncharacterized membrane protein